MLVFDAHKIGERLYYFRKKAGLTQWELAESAELSNRTYADIERGTVHMRTDTMIKICRTLHLTPNDLFVDSEGIAETSWEELSAEMQNCSGKEQSTALALLTVYLQSLK